MAISDCQKVSSVSKAVDSVLGAQYKWNGRGPDKFDCTGLVLWLYREVYGIQIKDLFISRDRTILESIRHFKTYFDKVDSPMTGDMLYFFPYKTIDLDRIDGIRESGISTQHLAVVENPQWAVEASRHCGVVRIELPTVMRARPEIYRLKDEYR